MTDRYSILPSQLHAIADSAEFILKARFTLTDSKFEESVSSQIRWVPTIHWKTRTGYIACEVSDRPFPTILTQVYAEITATGLPIRIISAYPVDHNLTARDFQSEFDRARMYGIGLLSTDAGNNGTLVYPGISIPLHIPYPHSQLKQIPKKFHKEVIDAYEMYMEKDPKHGVQELAQIVEDILLSLAEQAKNKSKLVTGGFVDRKTFYPQNSLINDMIGDKIIEKNTLKKCGGFADDRNDVSHKPRSIKEAIQIESRLRECFRNGMYLLEDLPAAIKDAGYKVSR